MRKCGGASTQTFWPVQPYTLSTLEERLKGMYRSVTDGKFSEALRQVNAILAIIPLTMVATRHEVDELKELISIARSALSSHSAHAQCTCFSVLGGKHVCASAQALERPRWSEEEAFAFP